MTTPLGRTDQRSQIKTFNIAPTWTHTAGPNSVFTFGGYVRKDQFNYYPSADLFADFSPALQAQTIAQDRRLTNAGVRGDWSYVKGMHNVKVGVTYQHWFLTENDKLGTVDSRFESLFTDSVTGMPCMAPSAHAPCATLESVDLTRPTLGRPFTFTPFPFHGHTDVKEASLYAQDSISAGNWLFSVGIRGDIYNGFVSDRQAEPRLGVAYNIKSSNTVLRLSYARTMETPFNENLVISSTGCSIPVIAVLVPPPNIPCVTPAIRPGWRNEFHAGLEQAFGKHLVVNGEYIWKYTHTGFDFGVVAATPIAFPIGWHNSKIPGYA
ncbi:MAG TPA: TonB-dependent receptor, partial [Candidatus Acidoferrales bacterium]|nr:TonB-dependent receptor [Candidatus Acidoferrales bacterium]